MGQLLLILPPIFILMGLLDVWVPRETMSRYIGRGSGIGGAALSFVLGSAAAGPLYGAFPVAAMLLKKGASLTNILVLIGAWSTTKIPLLMFEFTSLGPAFTLTRFLANLAVITIIAIALSLALSPQEKEHLLAAAEKATE